MMKYIVLIFVTVFFVGCFEEEKKEVVKKTVTPKKEPVVELAKKVQQKKDQNVSFSDAIEEDGIVVDGAKDEELLDAFGLAVSQIMTEEGVSVPDCTAIAKTEYLTKDECDEISEKYFGFYDIYTEDGVAKKVEDVFEKGITGESVEIRNEEIEYFDSSGNPLLDNLVEFEEFVDKADSEELLEDLLSKIPNDKRSQRERVKQKMQFLKDMAKMEETAKKEEKEIIKEKEEKEEIERAISQSEEEAVGNGLTKSECMSKASKLNTLKAKFKVIEGRYELNPNNDKVIDEYNEINFEITNLETELIGCQ